MYFSVLIVLLVCTSPIYANYKLVDNYTPHNFGSEFIFFTNNDPTHGYVNYVDQGTAERLELFKQQNGKLYMGADHTNVASGRGRNSVRITSKRAYTRGLFILDMEHMPNSQCGSWPAFWTCGPNWPRNGEIDIIEGVNTQRSNSMALHTSPGCSIKKTQDFTGSIVWPNCDVNTPGQPANAGCNIKSDNTQTYGDGFNAIGGGVYATEWTSKFISIWFFPRFNIPSDITNGNPNPNNWGKPLAKFSGCDFDRFFHNNNIIFDITFCGDWAGNVWRFDQTCSRKDSSCENYVKNNPGEFKDTYWLINSLKVYQNEGGPSPGGQIPRTNSLIAIKCNNGKFLSGENSNGPINCNRNSAQEWEKLRFSGNSNKFTLQAHTRKYCSSENGNSPMTCSRDSPLEWEEFQWISNGDGTFSIRCNNGRYLSSENGNGPMNCNREQIQAWEKFTWVQM